MTIETKIAKNGSTRYYVRDEETGKLTAISAAKVCELKRDNERQALEQKTNAYINGIFDEYEAANGVQHIDDKKTFRASLSATLDGYNSYGQQRYYATIDEAVNAVLFFNKNYYKFNNYANVEVNISRFDRVTYLTLGYNGNMTFSEEFFALKADDAAIEYAVTAEAMDIATEAEIENAQANDVKVTEQDNSNVTIDDNGKIFDSAKVTIEQAVDIISRLNYRNDTFQYRFTTREDNADIKYRHFDAYRDNGDKDAFAISEIVINGKLEIVRFYNLFRDIIVDLHIGNVNCKLGYKGAIEIVDDHNAQFLADKIARDAKASDNDNTFDLLPDFSRRAQIVDEHREYLLDSQEDELRDAEERTIAIPIRTKIDKKGRLSVKYGDAKVTLQAAVENAIYDYRHEPITVINQYGEEISCTCHIDERRIGRARDNVKAFVREVAGWKPITDEMVARFQNDRKASFYRDKIYRDAKPCDAPDEVLDATRYSPAFDTRNAFDLLPTLDELNDFEDDFEHRMDVIEQINREFGNFIDKIGDATVTFCGWQIVKIREHIWEYQIVRGKQQFRICGRLVSRVCW